MSTCEEAVKKYEMWARCVGVPVPGSYGRKIARYEILVGLNAHPPCIGTGKTPEAAWADALAGMEEH